MTAAIVDYKTFAFAHGDLQTNKEFVKELIKINPAVLQFASWTLKKDKEFVKELIKINPAVLQFASKELQAHQELQALAK